MNALDAIIIVLLFAAAVHGVRVGGLAQIAEFAGMLLGFALGAWLVLVLCPHVSGAVAKPLLAVALLVLPVALLGVGGRQVGLRTSKALRRFRVHVVDEVVGGLTAAATVLVVLWLFASVLVNSPLTNVSDEIEHSAILRGVSNVMPPIPDAFSGVERYLATTGFPQVLANITPQSPVEVQVATSAQVDATAHRVEDSVVKVIADGCGGQRDGSGFVVAGGLVVTNVHVVSGASRIVVETLNGRLWRVRPVLFDQRFDLAVLRPVRALGTPALKVDNRIYSRPKAAVIIGYPGGGPLQAGPAGVVSVFVAQGRDIYDQSLTVRNVYELDGTVLPGNSGSPLLATDGTVIGVVFSRSVSNVDIGFALAGPGVVQRIDSALLDEKIVATGSCIT